MALGSFKELKVIIKGDVDGSVEALSDSLQKLSTQEILVNLGGDKVGGSLDLMAYNSNQPFGFPGGEPDSGG